MRHVSLAVTVACVLSCVSSAANAQLRINIHTSPLPAALPSPVKPVDPVGIESQEPKNCAAGIRDLADEQKKALARYVQEIEDRKRRGNAPDGVTPFIDGRLGLQLVYVNSGRDYVIRITHPKDVTMAALAPLISCVEIFVGNRQHAKQLGLYFPEDPSKLAFFYSPRLGFYQIR